MKDQVEADQRLVDRIVKLFYWPAKMSVTTPSEPEVLFQNENGEENLETLSATDPYEPDSTVSSVSEDTRSSRAPDPATCQLYANLPSVHSVYSNVSSPATPATRTYSRKRPASKLGLNFHDLLTQSKRPTLEQNGGSSQRLNTSGSSLAGIQPLSASFRPPPSPIGIKPIQNLLSTPSTPEQFLAPAGVQLSNLRLISELPAPGSPARLVKPGTRRNNPGENNSKM